MRVTTEKICSAFENRRALKLGNSETDGTTMWLFGNAIAKWHNNGMWITNAGWGSKTTKERLNGLSGVHIQQRKGNWFLNGRAWEGGWVNVDAWNDGIEYVDGANVQEPEFDVTSEWMPEGYSKPVYAVYHTLLEAGLRAVEILLNDIDIPTRKAESDTDGVYRPNYFIVVRPEDVDKAVKKLSEYYCLA